MAAAKLTPAEIKSRLENIDAIYQNYIKKIENIRNKERDILSNFIKKMENKKLTEIRRSIQSEYK
ncbi:MAG: hypothetical protein WCJ57_00445 [Candidatus Falkowbacteria bacterium]